MRIRRGHSYMGVSSFRLLSRSVKERCSSYSLGFLDGCLIRRPPCGETSKRILPTISLHRRTNTTFTTETTSTY